MKAKEVNRSSEKTKNAIKLAFAQLLKEKKELKKITVSELVKKADINRGTFYIHYDSIFGVAEEFESEIMESLSIENISFTSKESMYLYFDEVFKYLKENEKIYKMLLDSDAPLLFMKKLTKQTTNALYKILNNNSEVKKSKSLQFDVSFFVNGIYIQIFKYFTDDNFSYTLDDIRRYIEKYFNILFLE